MRPHEGPVKLTKEEYAALKDLWTHTGYVIWERELRGIYESTLERLKREDTPEFYRCQGKLKGLDTALTLVETLVEEARHSGQYREKEGD